MVSVIGPRRVKVQRPFHDCRAARPQLLEQLAVLTWCENVTSITRTMLVILLNKLAPSCAACFGAGSCCLVILGSSLDAPVKYVVVLVLLVHDEVTEEFVKIGVVRLVVEAKNMSVV